MGCCASEPANQPMEYPARGEAGPDGKDRSAAAADGKASSVGAADSADAVVALNGSHGVGFATPSKPNGVSAVVGAGASPAAALGSSPSKYLVPPPPPRAPPPGV